MGLRLLRYGNTALMSSALDPLEDMQCFVGALGSEDYLSDLLWARHGLSKRAAREKSSAVQPYVEAAMSYLQQADAGPSDISFLPLYYALLNMMRAYVIIGPYSSELNDRANRTHGLSYDQTKKSHSLMTERLYVRQKGSISLFYKTLTGESVQRRTTLLMRDVYPFLVDVSAEYMLAAGAEGGTCGLDVRVVRGQRGVYLKAQHVSGSEPPSVKSLKVLRGCRYDAASKAYCSKPVADNDTAYERLAECIRPELVYLDSSSSESRAKIQTPVSGRDLLFPEELPIALVFFHMSALVRYNPQSLVTFRESRYWPMMMAARRHCLLKFLKLFWSYVHQEAIVLTHQR